MPSRASAGGDFHVRGEEGRRKVDVDEAGARDLEPLDHVAAIEGRDDALGQLARLGAQALGGPHRTVGLVVAELGARALGEQRLAVRGNADGAHRGLYGGVQVVAKVHGRRLPGVRTRRAIVAAGGRRAKGAPARRDAASPAPGANVSDGADRRAPARGA